LHKEWSIRALQAGIHVLCEKPLALNADDAREMYAEAERCNRVLIEAFMYRAHPQTKQLVDFVQSGGIGELKLIRTNMTFHREPSLSDARYQADQGGGSLMDVGCYCIDFTRTLAGAEPTQLSCTPHIHDFGVDDYAVGTLGFESGLLATFTCGMTVESDPSAHIAGTDGYISIMRFWNGEGYEVHRHDGSSDSVLSFEKRPLYAIEADAFAETIKGGPNWNLPENTINNMIVLDKLRESITPR
ncbi:MAG: Gfo/Idh/MocA family oxidoreductase, partial [Verrucomicrobiota bacterium]